MGVAITPKYDGATKTDWQWGDGDTGSGVNVLRADTTGGFIWLMHDLRLQPGTYTLKEAEVAVQNWNFNTAANRLWFFVCSKSGDTHTNLIDPIDLTGDVNTATNDLQQVQSTTSITAIAEADRTFVVASGADIRIGYCLLRTSDATNAGTPYLEACSVGCTEDNSAHVYTFIEAAPGDVLIGDTPPAPTSALVTSWPWAMRKLVLQTTARTITSETGALAIANGVRSIPKAATPFWVVFEDVSQSDGEDLTFDFENVVAGTVTSRIVAKVDYKLAGASDDVMTFGGNDVSLNGTTTEGGNSFDWYFYIDPATKSIDWFYVNRTIGQGPLGASDTAIISHTSKRLAVHGGTLPTMAVLPTQVSFSKSGSIPNIETMYVCREPVVVFGDSQAIDAAARIGGQLPTAFAHDRILINAALTGSRISTATGSTYSAGTVRHCASTPGQGDICDMRDVILAITAYMGNDIAASQTAAQINTAWTTIVDDAVGNGVEVILLGGFPLADGHADALAENPPRMATNTLLEALAVTNSLAWFNPYNAIKDNQGGYLDSGDDLHLIQAGSEYVTSQLAAIYEYGSWGDGMGRGVGRSRGHGRRGRA